jgi:membrane protease YdiL (CAAX protease family)
MMVETLIWAIILAGTAKVLALLLAGNATPLQTEAGPSDGARQIFARIVAYIGAGIYEELLFRMLLLPAVAGLIHLTGTPKGTSYLLAAILTAVGFALAHYLPGGETFVWNSVAAWHALVFRTLAGLAFAGIFLWRGFGIAAGVHVAYDILTIWL